MDPEEDLDISWVQDQEKIIQVDQNYTREPISSIYLYSLFVNLNSYVDQIICDPIELDQTENGKTVLSKEKILYYIQQKKKQGSLNGKKYRLHESLSFLVDLEPEQLQEFSQQEPTIERSNSFLKVLSVLNDIVFPESIFIFHSLNSIYFIFKEVAAVYHPISILKKDSSSSFSKTKKHGDESGGSGGSGVGGGGGVPKKQTKRVSIITHPLQSSSRRDHTHKQRFMNHTNTKKNN
jgi:hypothetical protein